MNEVHYDEHDPPNWDDEGATISGLTALASSHRGPRRPEVPSAIKRCQQSGHHRAHGYRGQRQHGTLDRGKCGILKPEDDFLVLEGKEFNEAACATRTERELHSPILSRHLDEEKSVVNMLHQAKDFAAVNARNSSAQDDNDADEDCVNVESAPRLAKPEQL
ncbi:PREDICTED: plasma membrane calcium-transporting ATPase 2-like [Priapulus caudatus]|uniref:Plasma membrane calcium-transporting ATPase 2-like n=1 Tax=Priapulus caudatus TaxID=37621 RepID=A0ABM1E6U8_PRICU|nr:PREDICTED: plasma membrane calcium-transporting ATPase 2-like [Priapulus caudatus]